MSFQWIVTKDSSIGNHCKINLHSILLSPCYPLISLREVLFIKETEDNWILRNWIWNQDMHPLPSGKCGVIQKDQKFTKQGVETWHWIPVCVKPQLSILQLKMIYQSIKFATCTHICLSITRPLFNMLVLVL